MTPPLSPVVLIRGAGEMASAIAWRLHRAGIRRICMLELPDPLCVRRQVSFCIALEGAPARVEGIEAVTVRDGASLHAAWDEGRIGVMLVEHWQAAADRPVPDIVPDVVVDAILAKRNIATAITDAALVVALGPGFHAGRDCHLVIETNRGHHLGRIIEDGAAAPNTGVPGAINGIAAERVLRAPADGVFEAQVAIGAAVPAGAVVGSVDGAPVVAGVGGMIRGLLRSGTPVWTGLKLGDVDPRGEASYCDTISDKARALSGSVLEAVMRHVNRDGGR